MQVAQHQQQQQQQWSETAYDWWQRSKRARAVSSAAPPTDPASAAWAFLRPTPSSSRYSNNNGTGIAFVDAALRRNNHAASQSLPVVDIRGSTGKTWTILSLAARFVVATRPSQFATTSTGHELDNAVTLPQVIILDSKYDVTTPKLAYAVRSMLLRKLSSSTQDDSNTSLQELDETPREDPAVVFERDMKDCLGRIHVGTVDDLAGWVPLLECIRQQLTSTAAAAAAAAGTSNTAAGGGDQPTLLLWDGFLSEEEQQQQSNNNNTEATRMEVLRQLERLLLECNVVCVTTTGNHYRPREYERLVTHRIRLDTTTTRTNNVNGEMYTASNNNSRSNNPHEYMATVYGVQIPFSISMAGILS